MLARPDRISILIPKSQHAAIDSIASAAGFREDNQPAHIDQRAALRLMVAKKLFEKALALASADPSWITTP